MTLARSDINGAVRIVDVKGAHLQLQLAQLGIRSGAIVVVKRTAPLGGPVLLETRGVEVAIGRRIAEHIVIEDAR